MIQQPEDSYLIGVFIKLDAESYKKKNHFILSSVSSSFLCNSFPIPTWNLK